MKAVLHYRPTPGFRAALDDAPEWLDLAIVPEDDPDAFATEIADAEVLLHVLEPVTAAMIAGAPKLALIQKIGVGVNTIDLDAARAGGVGVANMPGTNAVAVAELALALMLAALRRVVTLDATTRTGRWWGVDPAVIDSMGELGGRTVGLVGFGAVARHLAPVLTALGAEVRYTATGPKDDTGAAEWRELPALLTECDVVSLHLPLTPATERLLDAEAFAAMRPGAVLVNTARGGLVDEPALVDALTTGRLRAAGLDVFATEPVEGTNPLLALDNVVVGPHLAWLTPETLARSMGVAYENCRRVRDGEPLLHEVVARTRGLR